jgi:MFS family permease
VTISDDVLVLRTGEPVEQVALVEVPGMRETAAGPSALLEADGRQPGGHRAGTDDPRTDPPAGGPARYRDVFAVREYAGMFTAELCSLVGDQIAAVAVSVLLYQRSGSPLLAALGYATVYLPWAVGGPLLSVLADRLPPRRVMIGCHALQAGLIGLAALPGLPLALVAGLVLVTAFLAPPFDAAISSTTPQILEGEQYALAISIRSTAINVSMLAGFAGGGLLVAAISPNGALALDALSFAVSALILSAGLQARPAAMSDVQSTSLLGDAVAGLRVVAADRRRFGPLLLGIAGAAYIVVPEGIATAYAHLLGFGAAVVGLLMASVAVGHVVGAVIVGRLMTEPLRRALMWPMALAGTVPLMACLTRPGLTGTLVLFALAGGCSAFQVTANTTFALAVPAEARGRAFGLAMTSMYAVQSVAVVGAGAAATLWSANQVVAGVAVLGAIAIVLIRPVVVPARTRAHRTLRAQSVAD